MSQSYKTAWKNELHINPHLFHYYIIKRCNSQEEAKKEEGKYQKLLNVRYNPLYANKHIQGDKFSFHGGKHSEETRRKLSNQRKGKKLPIEQIQKWENTMMIKYGVKTYTQTPEYHERFKKHCLEKYGVDNPFKSENIKEKIKSTKLEKYGVEHHCQNDEWKKRQKQRNIEKYGVEAITQLDSVKVKTKQRNIEKYGVDNPMKNAELANKCLQNRHTTIKKIVEMSKEEFRIYLQTQNMFDKIGRKNTRILSLIKKRNEDYCDYYK